MVQLASPGEEKMEHSIAAPTVRRNKRAHVLLFLSMSAVLLVGVLVGALVGGPGTDTRSANVSSEKHAWTSSDSTSPVSTPSLRPASPSTENDEMDELSRGESTQESSTLFSTNPKCKQDESMWSLDLITDEYPFETSWALVREEGIAPSRILAVGPPVGTYYERHSHYSSSMCLTPGEYTFEMQDSEGDGLCCDVGNGTFVVAIDDIYVVNSDDSNASNFAKSSHRFRVGQSQEEHVFLSSRPTALPSTSPSNKPTRSPTDSPTETLPTYPPSADPSSSPTSGPTKQPVTESPTTSPSSKPSAEPTKQPKSSGPLTFLAIGDVPYSPMEECLLPLELNKLNASSGRFLIHLGDIQDGKICSCPESLHIGISRLFEASPLPTFFIIGDNGWLDCDNYDESYSYWKKHLFTFHSRTDLDWPPLGAAVNHNPDYPEFFAFKLEDILFLGRALPATANLYRKFSHSQWQSYLKINAAATRNQIENNYGRIRAAVVFGHSFGAEGGVTATFFERMTDIASDFPELPILLVQDNHWWEEETFSRYPNLYKLALDDTVTPTSITINPEATGGIKDIFTYDRGCWCTEGHRPTKLTNWSSSGACAGVCDTNKQCATEEPCGSFGSGGC